MGPLKRVVNLLGAVYFRNYCSLKGGLRVVCRRMSMKALVVEEFGDSSKLKYSETTRPVPTEGEVLVKNQICGLNYLDVIIAKGALSLERLGSKFPVTMGVEAAGTVDNIGNKVDGIAVGERVAYTFIGSRAHAEYSKVPASSLVKIPPEISFEQAATAMIQGMTAHYLVHTTGRVKPGDKVLVHTAAGGTGSLVCQVAKNAGVRPPSGRRYFDITFGNGLFIPAGAFVIGTTSTEAKAAKVRESGADEVILYPQKDFVQEVNRITDGKGVNVIYDGVGKTTLHRGFNCLALQGIMVSYGVISGTPEPVEVGTLAKGSFSLCRPSVFHHIATSEDLKWRSSAVFDWIKEDKVKFGDFTVLPLSDGRKAYELLESGKSTGKILMKP